MRLPRSCARQSRLLLHNNGTNSRKHPDGRCRRKGRFSPLPRSSPRNEGLPLSAFEKPGKRRIRLVGAFRRVARGSGNRLSRFLGDRDNSLHRKRRATPPQSLCKSRFCLHISSLGHRWKKGNRVVCRNPRAWDIAKNQGESHGRRTP